MDEKFLFAVGQATKEINGNLFSTLIPIARRDGDPVVDPRVEFPNRGRVWWMVRGANTVGYAPPGCLVLAGVEESVMRTADPDKDHWQALQPTLPRLTDFIEILTPPDPPSDPAELLDGFSMICDHEPTRFVLVRLGSSLYGPLKIILSGPENDRELQPEIGFSKPAAPHRVHRFDMPSSGERPGHIRAQVHVWPSDRMLGENQGHLVHYEAMTGALFEELRNEAEEVDLVGVQEALRQLSGAYQSRKQRQDFINRFTPLVEQAEVSPAVMDRARKILASQTNHLDALNEFFDGVLSDEAFKPRIEAAIDARVEARVTELAAQIDARAQERVRELTQKRSDLETRIQEEEERFLREAARRRQELELDLEAKRREAREETERRINELEEFEQIAALGLQEATDRLSTERSALLGDYLAIEPLLRRLTRAEAAPAVEAAAPAPAASPGLALPAVAPRAPRPPASEEDFFQRFSTHVDACGFRFDREDLLAFHLAAKQRGLVILGGMSGTGKSSLPLLYAEALAGEEREPAFLSVDVNPSWTSPSDLFGYVDALERRFMPAPSGFSRRAILAAHEHRHNGPEATLHGVCFDEMNLAQPEHYMADVIQAVSRSPGQQAVSLFDPQAVRPDDPFQPHARLELAPNLLLFGTVNFDETTRPLSLRLLDRCSLIEFRPSGTLPSLTVRAATGRVRAKGETLRLADLQHWTRLGGAPPRVVAVLDAIQPELRRLGCAIAPRRQSAILDAVANAPPELCDLERAIDMQLLQRALPQIRNLYRPGAMEALKRLSGTLERLCQVPRTLEALAEIERQELDMSESFALSEE
ncbi:hypothetical protein [Neomegalonema sp.]|uniref:hypothetical protein n=1 Tax=Neomegalonema sp. TaxID=2039713 RepID=UPI00260F8267|nr:hypothetical protein [Neomegalonema sp.]MDD2867787.1 hypothetical protein [Neomegalonema sp.]